MNLIFQPLEKHPWIQNARVTINQHFSLSVSYNLNADNDVTVKGRWYVGIPGAYEAAVLVHRSPTGDTSLVSWAYNAYGNTFLRCNTSDLEAIVKRCEHIRYGGEIKVFDQESETSTCKIWKHRFFCAEGFDKESKLTYVRRKFNDMWMLTCL